MLSIWKECVKWNTFALMNPDSAIPRRHPERGGYACGEETRARIIATALQVFGEHGYEQASTRLIAAAAGVNPPALQYYFDGKEGLLRACVQTIIDRVWQVLSPALADAEAALEANSTPQALRALLGLLDALADGLVAAGAETWSRFLARGKADGAGPTVMMMRERISQPLLDRASRLVGLIIGRSAAAEETRLRTLAVLSQVNSFHANRDQTLAVMGWSRFDARNLAAIKAVVHRHTCAALGVAEPMAPGGRRQPKTPRAKPRSA